jgi:hypothetical protein
MNDNRKAKLEANRRHQATLALENAGLGAAWEVHGKSGGCFAEHTIRGMVASLIQSGGKSLGEDEIRLFRLLLGFNEDRQSPSANSTREDSSA